MVPRFAIGHTRAVCNGWCKAAQELRRDIHSRTKFTITESFHKITNKYTIHPNIFNHLLHITRTATPAQLHATAVTAPPFKPVPRALCPQQTHTSPHQS